MSSKPGCIAKPKPAAAPPAPELCSVAARATAPFGDGSLSAGVGQEFYRNDRPAPARPEELRAAMAGGGWWRERSADLAELRRTIATKYPIVWICGRGWFAIAPRYPVPARSGPAKPSGDL